jgi:hypothetical protein
MRARPLVAVAALLSLAAAASADAARPKLPWEGFGVGSYVHTKQSTKMSMAGMPAMPEQPATETKQTLVKVTDEAWTVKTETKMGETWTGGTEMVLPRKFSTDKVPGMDPKVVPEELGSEKVTVEGTAYDCKKTKVKTAQGGTVTAWTHEKEGALKTETEIPGQGTMTMTVTALAKKAKAGDKEVVCREAKIVSKMSMGGQTAETTTTTLTSESVPGHTVRTEIVMAGQMSMTTLTEVVAFEAK